MSEGEDKVAFSGLKVVQMLSSNKALIQNIAEVTFSSNILLFTWVRNIFVLLLAPLEDFCLNMHSRFHLKTTQIS